MKVRNWILVFVACSVLMACGDDGTQDTSADDATDNSSIPSNVSEDNLIGVWEQQRQDAVGQTYLNIFELRADGSYSTHMADNTPDDTGRYTFLDDSIVFESSVSPLFSREVKYTRPSDSELELLILLPGGSIPIPVRWNRSQRRRILPVMNLSGIRLPREFPQTIAALLKDAQVWQQDAVPTAARFESDKLGEFSGSLHFFSPSRQRELRLTVTPFEKTENTVDGSRSTQAPLPAQFLDLPLVLIKARESDLNGTLTKAELRVWGDSGPVWRLVTSDNKSGFFSAVSGEKFERDVTGFQDQYEADWNFAHEQWRQVLELLKPKPQYESDYGSDIEMDCYPRCDIYDSSTTCTSAGGTWNPSTNPGSSGSCN